LAGAPFVLLGALPWLLWNARHDFDSLQQPQAAVASTYTDRLHLFFARLLPTALGLRRPFTGSWLLHPPIGVSLYVLALVAFAIVAWRAFTGRAPLLRPLVLIALLYPLLFADDELPRRGAPLCTDARARHRAVHCVGPAHAGGTTRRGGRRHRPCDRDGELHDERRRRQSLQRRVLAAEGVDRAYADYWIAYPLTLATHERIVASPVDAVRSARLAAAVASAPRSTYIVFRERPRDDALRATLTARHIPFRHRAVGRFSVYVLSQTLPPSSLTNVWALPSP
jgi:hypothetical protein